MNQIRSQTGLVWVQELAELYKPMRGHAEEGGAVRNRKAGKENKCERDQLHVEWSQPLCLSG